MTALPTVPGPFADDTAPSLTQLQQLSGAVSFLSDATFRPLWHLYKASGASLVSGWNVIAGPGSVAYDNDGVHQGGLFAATIVTQGYYSVEACLGIKPNATATAFMAGFTFTAGAGNPHNAPGTVIRFGARGGSSVNDNTADSWLTPADDCPQVCYPGDILAPAVYVSGAQTLSVNSSPVPSYISGRFNLNFTGFWTGQGT